MKVYEVILDEANPQSGINAISLVNSPAIDIDFIALSKEKPTHIKLADEDRQVLMGAALIPNKPIYRKVGEEEFYILFSKETIRRASELYFIRNRQQSTTLEHEGAIDGLTTVESWIVEDITMDKSKIFGFDVPLGTWMVSMKVDNNDVWTNLVKTGEVKGFSIEGFFMPELREKLSKTEPIDEYKTKLNEVKKLIGMI
jgi:hypothetical protein